MFFFVFHVKYKNQCIIKGFIFTKWESNFALSLSLCLSYNGNECRILLAYSVLHLNPILCIQAVYVYTTEVYGGINPLVNKGQGLYF